MAVWPRPSARAQAAVDPLLPGFAVAADPAPVVARLTPAAPVARRSDFLPLLSDASSAMLSDAPALSLRRLSYADREGRLSLLIEAEGLEELQSLERAMAGAGLSVRSGAATAAKGAAQAEFTVTRAGT